MLSSRGAFIVLLAVALGCTPVEPASTQSVRELDQLDQDVNDDVMSSNELAGATRRGPRAANVVWGNTVYYNLPTWNLLQLADADGTLFQIAEREPRFATAEWAFTLGLASNGTEMPLDGAQLAVDFAFEVLAVIRLQARAAVANGRGDGALRTIGAVQVTEFCSAL